MAAKKHVGSTATFLPSILAPSAVSQPLRPDFLREKSALLLIILQTTCIISALTKRKKSAITSRSHHPSFSVTQCQARPRICHGRFDPAPAPATNVSSKHWGTDIAPSLLHIADYHSGARLKTGLTVIGMETGDWRLERSRAAPSSHPALRGRSDHPRCNSGLSSKDGMAAAIVRHVTSKY